MSSNLPPSADAVLYVVLVSLQISIFSDSDTMELSCAVQTYAWGKLGGDSEVARLAARACSDWRLEEAAPYAELWMGTHSNGPATLATEQRLLSEHIAAEPECLGAKVRAKFGDQLPFLFKVLSVNKALSIQAHPDKRHAEQLHAERPSVYKDPNHKPEIAIALTHFEGLCGFRPLPEIQNYLATVPELRAVCGKCAALEAAAEDNYQHALKDCFESLMVCSKEVLVQQLDSLQARLSALAAPDSVSALFLRLHSQYPGDVGCFVIFFLNVLTLAPGESMFLGPNVPHAYLAGDCVEVIIIKMMMMIL